MATIIRPPLRRMTPMVHRRFSNDLLELIKGMSDWRLSLKRKSLALRTLPHLGAVHASKSSLSTRPWQHTRTIRYFFCKIDVDEAQRLLVLWESNLFQPSLWGAMDRLRYSQVTRNSLKRRLQTRDLTSDLTSDLHDLTSDL